ETRFLHGVENIPSKLVVEIDSNLVRQVVTLVGDEMEEGGILKDHEVVETDGEYQGDKLGEMEPCSIFCRREGGLDAKPNNQDGGEGSKKVLTQGHEKRAVLV